MERTFYINFYPDGQNGDGNPESYTYDARYPLMGNGYQIEVTVPDPNPTVTVKVVGK